MTNAEAFETVELEIKSKRTHAELAREYVAERPNLGRAAKEGKLHEAKWLDGEADALQLVLDLARKNVAPKAELPVGRVETITLVRKPAPAPVAAIPCPHYRTGWCETCAST